MRFLSGLRGIFWTPRGRRQFAAQSLIAFGLISAIVQFTGQVFGVKFDHPAMVTGISLAVCVIYGVVQSFPRTQTTAEFRHPDLSITVRVGDILSIESDLVVGFCDTFDTDTSDNIVINRKSLQGQLLHQLYDNDRGRLDKELDQALSGVQPVFVEPSTAKRGKLERYPVGTVAVIGSPDRRIYCLAYSRMSNTLLAESSIDDLWLSLSRLWATIADRGQLNSVAIPIIGAELARVSTLDRENLLKVIILSFAAQSRVRPICRELTVVVRPSELDKVDMLEVRAFLGAL
ncbi:macro domain-containing protein [Herbidospora cretacea]|uniref:macro domain-containing protein n=1 Tax=Herbidospora cretacea TaxID=28444 RepID=UPI0004C2CA72|nr:macro domain-containing protein [Herbidospora cretacea]